MGRGASVVQSFLAAVILASPVLGQPSSPRPQPQPAPSAAATANDLTPWVTRQLAFHIPFTVPETGQAPLAVELFVSSNEGTSWQLAARQRPDASGFLFQAPQEGQYWFTSRTVHQQQPPPTTEQLRPELVVLVDLTQPKLQFEAKAGPAGEVLTTWEANDPALDAETFRMEYLPRAGATWKPVPLEATQTQVSKGSHLGRLSWWPETDGGSLHVRAEISDRAGNKSVVNRLVLLPQAPAQRAPAANAYQPSGPPYSQPPPVAVLPDNAIAWPTDNQLPRPQLPRAPRADSTNAFAAEAAPPTRSMTANRDRTIAGAPNPRSSAPVKPSVGTQFIAAQEKAAAPSPDDQARTGSAASMSRPPETRMTRSARFQMDYDVESVGSAGIRDVELWGTEDGGVTWSLWKKDEDRRSPLDVQVDQDGIYGFRIIVVAQNGLAGTAPSNGADADLWVGVDTHQPEVRITSAIYGEGQYAGHLDIRWKANDFALGPQPVRLSYSDSANGPWTTIATDLANSGQHYWKVDPRIPQKILLRLEVEDEAGNVGRDQLSEPINLAGLIPTARIRGFRPLP